MNDPLKKFLPWIAVAVVAIIVIVIIGLSTVTTPEDTRDAPNMRTHTGEVIECIFTGDVLVCDFGG